MQSDSVRGIATDEDVEIGVDTCVRTGIKINANRPGIFVHDRSGTRLS